MEEPHRFTREDLKNLCKENGEKIRLQKIESYVSTITERVLKRNNDGHTTSIYYFEKAINESAQLIKDVANRVSKIFVDSEVSYCIGDTLYSDYILVDWSPSPDAGK